MLPTLRGKQVLVLGLGVHGGGVAVARWLAQRGARVTVSDLKTRAELAESVRRLRGLGVRYVLGSHPPSLLRGCDLVVQNPAVPRELPLLGEARRRGVPIENEATLFLKLCPAELVIGVTGSKGKSTTTALLGAMVRRARPRAIVAGNIRDTVMFEALPRVRAATPVVLELSSWHLELVDGERLRLPVAVVTNVVPEHLNRYRSLGHYARAKAGIFRHQRSGDAVVLNYDNPVTRSFARLAPGRVCWFSLRRRGLPGVYVARGRAWWRAAGTTEELFRVRDLALPGEHNLANALAAAAAAKLTGVPRRHILSAVRAFRGLHDRLELVRTVGGVAYYNDTTATAPAAAQAALKALAPRPTVLIAGGVDKELDYRALARDVRRLARAVVLLPGTATVKLQRALRGYPPQLLAASMRQAVRFARLLAPPGGAVLLSPGAASFNLFRHEFHRGWEFARAVEHL